MSVVVRHCVVVRIVALELSNASGFPVWFSGSSLSSRFFTHVVLQYFQMQATNIGTRSGQLLWGLDTTVQVVFPSGKRSIRGAG